MSAQAGIWNFDGGPVAKGLLDEFSNAIAQHGPDGAAMHFDGPAGMLYRPVHTTCESRAERQPHISCRGFVITWDGRLDNREDLIHLLHDDFNFLRTDVELVAAAFDRWDTACFGKLIGDWAISIWDPKRLRLILARDYMGMRHLYYHLTPKVVVWCTYLDAIILSSRSTFTLSDEYIAGYMGMYPAEDLTPYREVGAVPPGCFVTIRKGESIVSPHWSFEPARKIRYKTDAEYEEHFRYVFRQAVRRRMRSDTPLLAELSGGLDSSSIICVADDILAKGEVDAPGLETVSFYDPKEPGGGDLPYICRMEEYRGKKGHHVDVEQYSNFFFCLDYHDFIAVPGSSGKIEGVREPLFKLIQRQGIRTILSGIGGDEFLGGVPDPLPQLADLILLPRPVKLTKQLMAWSLIKKRPLIQLLFQTLIFLVPAFLRSMITEQAEVAPWIDPGFARRHHISVQQLGPKGGHGFWLPSRRDFAKTFVTMRRQMSYFPPHILGYEERRYPFLDQTLIEFLISIPASQLLRPGQRRSLMRRSLAGMVPAEILSRRTKGNGARSHLSALQNIFPELEALFVFPLSARMRYINSVRVQASLSAARSGDPQQLIRLLKTIYLELWLRGLAEHRVIHWNDGMSQSADREPAQQEVRAHQ